MPAPKNNQYAAKGKGYDGLLNIQTVKAEKAAYKAHAESKGLTLTDWVNKALREKLKRES
jgi:predicted HicB family RNase H-like nuclease